MFVQIKNATVFGNTNVPVYVIYLQHVSTLVPHQ